jgi:SAM-dependent methyltransferase
MRKDHERSARNAWMRDVDPSPDRDGDGKPRTMIESPPLESRTDGGVLPAIGAHLDVRRMPAHWLMARLGKRVLRPGGLEMTNWLLARGSIGAADDVIEFAPGMARTAGLIVARAPHTYAGVERDEQAALFAEHALARTGFDRARVVRGNAASVPLEDDSATVVIGEAMLSMQTPANKRAIMCEAGRLLRSGGRYLIHELAIGPEIVAASDASRIQQDLSAAIHVGVRIGTVAEWTRWLEDAGFVVEETKTAPMRLLELDRLIRDEGLRGTIRFTVNALRTSGAVRRLWAVRKVFRTHQLNLCAVAVVARKPA